MPTAAILLSRQPKHPHGGHAWVQGTVAAVNFAGKNGCTILTSAGMQTWENILAAARLANYPISILLDGETGGHSASVDELRRQFDLDMSVDIRVLPPSTERDARQARDEAVVSSADLLLPVSIRANGYMAALVERAAANGKKIDRSFVVPYAPRVEPLAYSIPVMSLSVGAKEISREYLTHWTRAASHHWPDERAIDYYAAIINSRTYPRTAFDTLCHILENRHLVASRRHMPRNIATVAFTGLPVQDVLPLMRWRAKYAEMAFEPYGIGIRRESALECGIYPVQYYDAEVSSPQCTVEPWLTQSIGMKTDWRQECEYRHKGDLSLKQIPSDALIAFCPTQKEAAALESAAGIRAVALFENSI